MQIKHTITFLLILVLITQPVSANFLDDFFDKITGRVTEETTTETIVEEEPTPEPEPEPVREEPAEEVIEEEPAIEEPICPPIPLSMWCSDCNIEEHGNGCLCPMKKDENGCTTWNCDACTTTEAEETEEVVDEEERPSCEDSLECPSGMKCENSVCIDVGCIKEGESAPSAGIDPIWLDHLSRECCEGLNQITSPDQYDENCNFRPLAGGSTGVCTKCGNGNCERQETECNCPEDCREAEEEEEVEIEVPPDCHRIILENGMEVIECTGDCPPVPQEVIQRCKRSGGNVIERADSRGCPFIDCEYEDTDQEFIGTAECPSEEALRDRKERCHDAGLQPIFVKKGECEVIKCSEKHYGGEKRCAEDVETKKRIKEECIEKGGEVAKEFDERGCPVTVCITPELECKKDVPPEAHENCEIEGGNLIVKRDPDDCIIFVDCMRRGEREIPYEEVEEVPPAAILLSVVLKLESLKIEFDKLSRKIEGIANYYEDTGNAEEAEKFRKVAGLFSSAKDRIEDIKTKLRSKAGAITKEDLREIKHDMKYISETIMQDALYILLGGEITLEGGGVTREGYTDCGSDSRCWEEAVRLCEPAVHISNKPIEGIIAKIHGLEDERFCIIEAEAEGHSMLCKVPDYGISMSGKEGEILKYCEGSLVEWLRSGQKPGEIEKPGCTDNCGDNMCDEMVCMAEGCPCSESPESCPEDCAPSTLPFELCTYEDEREFKECQHKGGNPQTNPSRYKKCEIYTGCLMRGEEEEYEIPLPKFLDEIEQLGSVTLIDFETLPDGTTPQDKDRLSGKEWENLGVVFEYPGEDYLQVFGAMYPFKPIDALSLSPGQGPFEGGGDTHDDLNIVFSEPVKAAGIYLLDLGGTDERESITFLDKDNNVIEKISPWPSPTFGSMAPGTFVGLIHEDGISEIRILENTGDGDDIAYDNLYFVK